MSDDETKRWAAEVEREIAELADEKLEHGERTELFNHIAEIVANEGLQNRTPYDARIRQLQNKRESLTTERNQIERDIRDLDDEIEVLRDKRDQFDSVEDKLEGSLSTLDSKLRRDGTCIYESNPIVMDISREYAVEPEEIVERMMKRNPDIPPCAFTEPAQNQWVDNWSGLSEEEQITLPPEEREEVYDR